MTEITHHWTSHRPRCILDLNNISPLMLATEMRDICC